MHFEKEKSSAVIPLSKVLGFEGLEKGDECDVAWIIIVQLSWQKVSGSKSYCQQQQNVFDDETDDDEDQKVKRITRMRRITVEELTSVLVYFYVTTPIITWVTETYQPKQVNNFHYLQTRNY